MTTTGIAPVDHAPRVVAEWPNASREELGWPETAPATQLLREAPHAVRGLLPGEKAGDLAAQVPPPIRSIHFKGRVPPRTPVHPHGPAGCMARAELHKTPLDGTGRPVPAVIALLQGKIPAGAFQRVAQPMQTPLRALFT